MENPNTYEVTAPSGKKYILRPLPLHFHLFYNQLPAFKAGEVAEALGQGEEAVKDFVRKEFSVDEQVQMAEFMRDAVLTACVKPKITMSPKNADEISPFQISGEDFEFLGVTAINPKDGEAKMLESFREGQKTPVNGSSDGEKVRPKTKRTA